MYATHKVTHLVNIKIQHGPLRLNTLFERVIMRHGIHTTFFSFRKHKRNTGMYIEMCFLTNRIYNYIMETKCTVLDVTVMIMLFSDPSILVTNVLCKYKTKYYAVGI